MFKHQTEAMHLARAYVPFQEYADTYRPECALERGTAFPQLDKPYTPCEYHRPSKEGYR